jgi:tight adherence protein B
MDLQFIVIVIIILIVGGLLLWGLISVGLPFGNTLSSKSTVSNNLRSLVAAQRQQHDSPKGNSVQKKNLALAAAAQSELSARKRAKNAKMTIEKKLRYAQWPITSFQFVMLQFSITLLSFVIFFALDLHWILYVVLTLLTWAIVGAVLDMAVDRRYKLFDVDYPVLLMSYVSLLKTGMNTITGLEAAAKGLDDGSLVRAEVELLIERLRLGLTEEQAISAFGEDVPHPELELFVQSLILSRRVGGTLSSTLERLAKQVRKRQQFREQAVAAVGMERGSIWVIAAIMTALLVYLYFTAPDLINPALKKGLGWNIFQIGLALIAAGMYWSRKVTQIKI